MGSNHIITVRHGSARAHRDLRSQLEAAPTLLKHGTDYVLHAILDFIVDGYQPIIDTIEEATLEMEDMALMTPLDGPQLMRLFALRRELVRFRRMLGPMAEVPRRLSRGELPCIDGNSQLYFRDVLDHVQEVGVTVDHLLTTLGSVFEVSQLLEQQRQGVITRQLAAWVAILAVPTAIAGIYGMNFDVMPELRWRFGYFGILAVMMLICGVLYVRFKRAKWL